MVKDLWLQQPPASARQVIAPQERENFSIVRVVAFTFRGFRLSLQGSMKSLEQFI
jgi:hypothetical protein